MIVSETTFGIFCSVLVGGLSGFWLVWDFLRLRRFWPQGEDAHDEIFGAVFGITLAVIGLYGVVRFHVGGG